MKPLQTRSQQSRLRYDQLVLLLAIAAGLPGSIAALILLWTGDFTAKVQWTLSILIGGSWLGVAYTLRDRVVRPLQTIANMLAALSEGDYSIRARPTRNDDPLGLTLNEINNLSALLREQRLGAVEATALLRRVMEEIDVAVFAFDNHQQLRLVNREGEQLLGQPTERLLGKDATQLGLIDCLEGDFQRIIEKEFPGSGGRWEIRRSTFRQGGLPHELLVLSDLSRVLREEERQAWKRIIRVLGHEINNSLAPIKSLAGSLRSRLGRGLGAQVEDDLAEGLGVISDRSEALSRFMASYAHLARLPSPTPTPMQVEPWVRRVAGLERRVSVSVEEGPSLAIEADSDQLEQLLINLVRNAADAVLETGSDGVEVGWRQDQDYLEVWVKDDGPGIADKANLFVPFYTTKPKGSGIGLALSLQIAEGHGGTLTLENRADRRGALARLRIPIRGRLVSELPVGPS